VIPLAGGGEFSPLGCFAFFLIVVTVLSTIIWVTYVNRHKVRWGETTYENVYAFLAAFAPVLGLSPERLPGPSDLAHARFTGLREGRDALLEFVPVQQGKVLVHHAHLIVRGDNLPELVVTYETWGTAINKWLGFTKEIEVGDRSFDRKFLLQGGDRAKRSLGRGEVRKWIEAVFAISPGIESLRLESGRIVVDLPVPRRPASSATPCSSTSSSGSRGSSSASRSRCTCSAGRGAPSGGASRTHGAPTATRT